MDLLYITNSRIPTEKANGYQISKMCSEYANTGLKVKLIVPIFTNPIKKNLFDFYHLENNFEVSYRPLVNLTFLNSIFPHFLFFIRQTSFILFLLPEFLFASRNNKIIFTRDILIAIVFKKIGYFTAYEAHQVRNKFKKINLHLIKKIDRVIANSLGTAIELRKGGVAEVIVCPNGVDLKDFEINYTKDDLRSRLNLPLDKKIIMYAGHFYDWKGTNQILDAAYELIDKKELIFVLVGGNEQDIFKIKELTQKRGLNNILLLGLKERNEIPLYLASADLLLLTLDPENEEAIYFTSPVKLFEYLAAKVSVIAADMPAIRNLVSDQEVIFYQPRDQKSLANNIVTALGKDLNILIDNGYKLAQKYSWQKRAQTITDYLKQ